jgi:hypothetical protein
MAETKPIQIFLCHASEDKAAVEAIYDRLKALGLIHGWTKKTCCQVSAGGLRYPKPSGPQIIS